MNMNSTTQSGFVSQIGPEYFSHQTLAPYRTEDIPKYAKQSKSHRVEKKFDKKKSVFRDWKEDSLVKMNSIHEHDTQFWKVNKFVKDPTEQGKVEDIIKDHIAELKAVYTYYASKSSFPYLHCPEFNIFL